MPIVVSKPEPLFGEDLFQQVTNRIMLDRDYSGEGETIIKGRLLKGSVAVQFKSKAHAHF